MLALLNQEPGYKTVEAYLPNYIMSTVNVAEVLTVLTQINIDVRESFAKIHCLINKIINFDAKQALLVGELRTITKDLGLSVGDRSCLALAIHNKLPVITADQILCKLSLDVEIKAIR